MHSIDIFKKVTGLQSQKMRTVLKHLFFKSTKSSYKIVNLNLREWCAFVINNVEKLRDDFQGVTSTLNKSITLPIPKEVEFRLPQEELYRIDPNQKNVIKYATNVYENYDSRMNTSIFRSTSERLFERYCEKNDSVNWVYKNGDKGQDYFSIVYLTGVGKQYLFYPDYIVQLKDGRTIIIETKGGESMINGKIIDKNIDLQIENKFEAFKNYATEKNADWAFVRDKDEELYFNNTNYSSNLSDVSWEIINSLF